MKDNVPFKTIALVFVAALVFYFTAYFAIEHLRTRHGPWEVAFLENSPGGLVLRVDQPALNITNVRIRFSGVASSTNLETKTVRFDQPRPVPFTLPFGECIFMDTTFQPGTVVIHAGGHEIELLPRVLTIDNHEHAWQANRSIVLEPVSTKTNSMRLKQSTQWNLELLDPLVRPP
jgi:hypothetical protein